MRIISLSWESRCTIRRATGPNPADDDDNSHDVRTSPLELDAELEQLRQRKQQVEAEIARLIQAIADGEGSKSLTAAIGERERELRGITDKLVERRPGSLRSTMDELRTFAVSRLTDIRKLIAHPESIDQARAALAEHFGAFTLESRRLGKRRILLTAK